jgi:LPS export ABC transporter permease LptG
MKILKKYILKEFFPPFLSMVFFVCLLYLVYEFFSQIRTFLTYKTSMSFIAGYLVMQVPLWVKDAIPASTLFAIIFSLRRMARDGEITAMKATGVNIHSVVTPLIVAGILLSLFGVLLNIKPVPDAYANKRMYLDSLSGGFKYEKKRVYHNLIGSGINGEKFTIGVYDYDNKIMTDVTVDYVSEKNLLEKQLQAREMRWQNGRWILFKGVERRFSKSGMEIDEEKNFTKMTLIIPDRPDDFTPGIFDIDEVDQFKLLKEIRRLRKHGMKYDRQLVTFHFRFAYPFASLVVTLLALPFCLGMGSSKLRQTLSIAYVVSISIIYYVALNVGHVFGTSRTINPVLGAWSADILFILIGLVFFTRIHR